MKIFKVSQDLSTSYNTYDSMIVVAKDEADARTIAPWGSFYRKDGDWWNEHGRQRLCDWPNSDEDLAEMQVTEIGNAAPNLERGVILSSFNAG